jgi:peroxin-5
MDKGGSSLNKLAQHGMNRGQYQQNQAGGSQQGTPGLNREQEEFSNRQFNLHEMHQEINQILQPINLPLQLENWSQEFLNQPNFMINPLEMQKFEQIYNETFVEPKVQQNNSQIPNSHWKQEFDNYQNQILTKTWHLEFEKHKENHKTENQKPEKNWQIEFNEIWNQMKENQEEKKDWAQEFGNIFENDLNFNTFDDSLETDPVFAECAPYHFEPVNPYLDTNDPFIVGMQLLESQGSLSLAALAFEAAVQRDEHFEQAWMMLGKTQAENEKESPAIAALQRCVQENPMNKEALMMLAVSYTNEGMISESFSSLDRWLKTSFPELAMSPIKPGEDVHERLQKYYLEAVSRDSVSGNIDSDLQIGLGKRKNS